MTIEFPGEPEEKRLVYFLLILICLFVLILTPMRPIIQGAIVLLEAVLIIAMIRVKTDY